MKRTDKSVQTFYESLELTPIEVEQILRDYLFTEGGEKWAYHVSSTGVSFNRERTVPLCTDTDEGPVRPYSAWF